MRTRSPISPIAVARLLAGVIAVCVSALPLAAQELFQSKATSIAEADAELGGPDEGLDGLGYTSHFNFDNRRLQDPPSSTVKRRCWVECELDDGSKEFYTHSRLRRVRVGDLVELRVAEKRVRVVSCRFWWRQWGSSRWKKTVWAHAEPGRYIEYAFLEWKGVEDYVQPIYFYSPPLLGGPSGEEAAAGGVVTMYFHHDYAFSESVRVYINGPHGAVRLRIGDDQHPPLSFREDGRPRTLAAYRVDSGELVTLMKFTPKPMSVLLDESICEDDDRDGPPTRDRPTAGARGAAEVAVPERAY